MSIALVPFLVLMACAFAWVGLDLLRKLLVVHAPVLPMTFQTAAPAVEEILTEHDVAEADLLEFVEVHGRDARFMHAVWDSIEGKIDNLRVALPDPPADSVDD